MQAMMDRREFLGASCVAGAALAGGAAAAQQAQPTQYLELRHYLVDAGEKRVRLDAFLADVAIPALNRIGIRPVGVFGQADPKKGDLYVLLPHNDLASVATTTQRLLADEEFVKKGAAALELPKNDPLYKRVESTLMVGFKECPRVETAVKADTRLFQLRIYESHSLKKGQMKIHMFNEGGEIALFRKCGMQPVFFGETLVGTKMPNLTYMLVFENETAQKANWKKFIDSPEWKALSRKPIYRDTVSRITNIILRPTSYSQV
jgi:hypothetical protein